MFRCRCPRSRPPGKKAPGRVLQLVESPQSRDVDHAAGRGAPTRGRGTHGLGDQKVISTSPIHPDSPASTRPRMSRRRGGPSRRGRGGLLLDPGRLQLDLDLAATVAGGFDFDLDLKAVRDGAAGLLITQREDQLGPAESCRAISLNIRAASPRVSCSSCLTLCSAIRLSLFRRHRQTHLARRTQCKQPCHSPRQSLRRHVTPVTGSRCICILGGGTGGVTPTWPFPCSLRCTTSRAPTTGPPEGVSRDRERSARSGSAAPRLPDRGRRHCGREPRRPVAGGDRAGQRRAAGVPARAGCVPLWVAVAASVGAIVGDSLGRWRSTQAICPRRLARPRQSTSTRHHGSLRRPSRVAARGTVTGAWSALLTGCARSPAIVSQGILICGDGLLDSAAMRCRGSRGAGRRGPRRRSARGGLAITA